MNNNSTPKSAARDQERRHAEIIEELRIATYAHVMTGVFQAVVRADGETIKDDAILERTVKLATDLLEEIYERVADEHGKN